MQIHFVCSGNAYRSRLAEAYLKSINTNADLVVSSSGIQADIHKNVNGPICWYGMRLMQRNHLVPHMSWREQQTTAKVLEKVDYLICMRQVHLDYCVNELGFKGKPYEVWEVLDMNEMPGFIPSVVVGEETDMNHIRLSEQTYLEIVHKVDDLIKRIDLYV